MNEIITLISHEGFGLNTNILETNIINISLLIGLLIYSFTIFCSPLQQQKILYLSKNRASMISYRKENKNKKLDSWRRSGDNGTMARRRHSVDYLHNP